MYIPTDEEVAAYMRDHLLKLSHGGVRGQVIVQITVNENTLTTRGYIEVEFSVFQGKHYRGASLGLAVDKCIFSAKHKDENLEKLEVPYDFLPAPVALDAPPEAAFGPNTDWPYRSTPEPVKAHQEPDDLPPF